MNSSAMLIGLVERRAPVDRCIFADTGGERPDTYNAVEALSAWLVVRGYPPIETVRATRHGVVETLEENCLRTKRLPSLAYGYRACSQKWKRDPQDKAVREWSAARAAWTDGRLVEKLIGFDADELHRAQRVPPEDTRYRYRYPLIDWGWSRDECVEVIARAGLIVPPKSSCFFCPASHVWEILDLRDRHPELLARALAIERAGMAGSNGTGKLAGLGGTRSWAEVMDADRRQLKLVLAVQETPCECFDGAGS